MFSSKKKDYFWNTVGTFLQSALSPILLIVVSRVNGVDDVGLFSFTFSMAVSLSAIALWGNRTFQVSDIKNKFSNENYILSRIITSFVTIIMTTTLIIANGYGFNKSVLLIIFTVVKIIDSVCDVLYGIMQKNGKLYISGLSLSMKFIIGVVVFLSIDLLSGDILLSGIGLIVTNVLVTILFDIKYIKDVNIVSGFNAKEAINILKVSSPAFVISFLSLFSLTAIRYFIDINKPDEIAYFGMFSMPITMVILIMSFILQPNIIPLANKYNYNKKEFYRRIFNLIAATLIIGLGAVIISGVIGESMVNLVFNVNVEGYIASLVIMMIGAVFGSIVSIYSTIFNIMRRFGYHAATLLVTNAVLIIVGCIFTVDLLFGSILFTIISFIQFMIMSYILFFKLRYDKTI